MHGEGLRQDALVQLIAEGLAVVGFLQAVPLEPVAKDLVEEDAAGFTGEDRGTGVRLHERRLPKGEQDLDHLPDVGLDRLVVGQSVEREGAVALVERQFHAIVGLGHRRHEEAIPGFRGLDLGTLAVDEPASVRVGSQRGGSPQELAVFGERRGVAPDPVLPVGAVVLDGPGLVDAPGGGFAREVVGLVLGLDLDLHVRLHLGELLQGALVLFVGLAPQDASDRRWVVVERHSGSAGAQEGERTEAVADGSSVVQ